MYNTLVSDLGCSVSANQAGLYILSEKEEESFLQLAACFAYNRKKYQEQRISIGQGLLGQTYLEGKTARLKEIPTGYLRITSGLGEAPPRFLAIIPLKINDRVEGVLEIASFQKLEDYQIEFLEKVGKNIAWAISSYKVRPILNSCWNSPEIKPKRCKVRKKLCA